MSRNRLRTVLGILAAASTVALAGCMDASLSQSGTAPASISIQDAPSAIEAFDIEISGGADAARTVTGDTEALIFELAVGEEHTIDVDSSNFLGTKSFTVPRGGLQLSVPVQEKIFVPDTQNDRLVMIDDMVRFQFPLHLYGYTDSATVRHWKGKRSFREVEDHAPASLRFPREASRLRASARHKTGQGNDGIPSLRFPRGIHVNASCG
ncbi:MAG: hypothetical protein GVY14_07975 [Spirochaetes bacterium]|jgi:hypothetical protein|nr:hypothetical protein [Spirochaetota bacterium]